MSEFQEMVNKIYKLYLELTKKEREKLRKVRGVLEKMGVSNNIKPYLNTSNGEIYAIINKTDFPKEISDVVKMIDEMVYWGYRDYGNVVEVKDWKILVTTTKYGGHKVLDTCSNLGKLLPLVTTRNNGIYEERYYYLGSIDDVNIYLVVEVHWSD